MVSGENHAVAATHWYPACGFERLSSLVDKNSREVHACKLSRGAAYERGSYNLYRVENIIVYTQFETYRAVFETFDFLVPAVGAFTFTCSCLIAWRMLHSVG